ncbi:hypothetical protein C8J57DRAFT_1534387 [Mycena rebaudengoi]|nr:hypothetical protein C8J57DRAFT_1534387 [Mycena rebaudengoi]
MCPAPPPNPDPARILDSALANPSRQIQRVCCGLPHKLGGVLADAGALLANRTLTAPIHPPSLFSFFISLSPSDSDSPDERCYDSHARKSPATQPRASPRPLRLVLASRASAPTATAHRLVRAARGAADTCRRLRGQRFRTPKLRPHAQRAPSHAGARCEAASRTPRVTRWRARAASADVRGRRTTPMRRLQAGCCEAAFRTPDPRDGAGTSPPRVAKRRVLLHTDDGSHVARGVVRTESCWRTLRSHAQPHDGACERRASETGTGTGAPSLCLLHAVCRPRVHAPSDFASVDIRRRLFACGQLSSHKSKAPLTHTRRNHWRSPATRRSYTAFSTALVIASGIAGIQASRHDATSVPWEIGNTTPNSLHRSTAHPTGADTAAALAIPRHIPSHVSLSTALVIASDIASPSDTTVSGSAGARRLPSTTTAHAAAASIRCITSRTSSRMSSLSIHPSPSRRMGESSDPTHRRRRARHAIIPVLRRVAIAQPAPLASRTRISEEQDIHANTRCRRRAQGRLEGERGVGAAGYFVCK